MPSTLCCCRFFELFEKYAGYKTGKLKLKKPRQLQVKQTAFRQHDVCATTPR
jgi:hypothetical protein